MPDTPDAAQRITTPPAAQRQVETLYEGKYLRMMKVGRWEYATRKKVSGIVGIVAVTDDAKLVLVEQFRAPVGRNVIELPAGLAGDIAGRENEKMETAARRELLEETGYECREMVELVEGVPSAGICDEVIQLFRASGLKKVGPCGGEPTEQITVHEVPLGEVEAWLTNQRKQGKLVDLKLYAGLYFARR